MWKELPDRHVLDRELEMLDYFERSSLFRGGERSLQTDRARHNSMLRLFFVSPVYTVEEDKCKEDAVERSFWDFGIVFYIPYPFKKAEFVED